LLELYQQIWRTEVESEITADDTIEQSELLLSGLVARGEGKLSVYNRIYQEIFNHNWVETQLKNLRPYSEAFRAWVDSGYSDESRLLRGKTLEDAEEWGKDKNLSYQEKQFLAASKEKEIQEEIATQEKEAQLERERKDREASEERNLLLTEANIKAQRQIRKGSTVVFLALFVAGILGVFAVRQVNQLASIENEIKTVQKLSQLAGDLRNKNLTSESDQALRQAGLSFRVNDHSLKQALLLASMAQAYQQLKKPDEAQKNITESLNNLPDKGNNITSEQELQIQVLAKKTEGNLLDEKLEANAIEAYQEAYQIIKNHPNETNPFKKDQIITAKNIESVHRGLLKLLTNQKQEKFRKEVFESLKEHFFSELEYLLKGKQWQEADERTWEMMLFIANREKERYLDYPQIESFSCPVLKKIDDYWLQNSNKNFGLSVQKKIWVDTGNRLGIKVEDWNDNDTKNYLRFASAVGWYNDSKESERGYVRYEELIERIKNNPYKFRGGLPIPDSYNRPAGVFFSRTAICKL
jgi:GUN4-like